MSDQKTSCFITFEGGDGAGKSTQLERTASWLRDQGVSVFETRQPGSTKLGQELRYLLLSGDYTPVPEAELLMFLADRAQHVRDVIQPALNAGKWVLCDRYTDSTMAYQLAARKLSMNADLEPMLRFAEIGCQPDLTFWLSLPTEVAAIRMRKREEEGEEATRLDKESLEFHQRVHQAFASITQRFPERIKKIDASASVDTVTQQIITHLDPLLLWI